MADPTTGQRKLLYGLFALAILIATLCFVVVAVLSGVI